MAKRKRKNETTTVYKSLLRKTNIAKIWEWTHVLRKGEQFLFHLWHLTCYSCYHQVISYEKLNISVVICDMDTRNCWPSHGCDHTTFEVMTST
jgi:hypothetical protein